MFNQSGTSATGSVKFWANCPEHRTLEEFAEYLVSVGNRVLEVDEENQRILIHDEEF